MQVKYDLVVDFARPTKSNTIILSEGDVNSRVCHFVLLNNKSPFSMGDVTVATVRGVKKNGALVFGEAEFIYDEAGNKTNEVNYIIPAAIADEAGDVTMTITLMSSEGEQITSFEFYLKVRNALFNEDDMISDSDLTGFRDLLNRCTAALEKMEAMTEADALPNPYGLDIEIEGEHTVYTGIEPKEISLNNMAYIDESEEVDIEDALDESAASRAAASAQAASDSKDAIELLVNQAGDVANTINGYRNEALQYKNDAENYKLGSLQASLVSEGYSSGTQNGVPVGESSPYFENNAKYYADESAKGKGDLANRIDSLAGNVAEEWTAKTYLPGEYVLYNDKLWKCLNATASTPAENYYWESVKISDELGSGNTENQNVYSYDEQIVGTYMGKTLYRKVVEEAFGSYSAAHCVPIGVTDYSPVDYKCFRVAPDGTLIKAFNQQSNSGYWLTIEKFASDGIYYRSAGWNSGTFRAIVEYTKK